MKKKQNQETLEILLVIYWYQRQSNENLFRAARQMWTLQVSTEDSWVLYLMVSWTCTGPTSRIKKRAARAVPRASQVNSWTVEYLASTKYEAQLAFKRTSSPGATWRSQPARPWSVARREPRVKAEGLCHCVADVSNPSPPPLHWGAQCKKQKKQRRRQINTSTREQAWHRTSCTFETLSTLLHKRVPSSHPAPPHQFRASSIATSSTQERWGGAPGNNKALFKWALQGLEQATKYRRASSQKNRLPSLRNEAASIHYTQVGQSYGTKREEAQGCNLHSH